MTNEMNSNEIRKKFLEFFRSKGHTVVSSDSLVPANDPSLLFTGAGMNQFKDYFLGLKKEMTRAASCQKCFRTGDVEQVGRTPSHLTFFEMLGNFSFGDYFKKEAVLWAWEFMTQELKIAPERLWVTVYESDDEAEQIWKNEVKFPAKRIVRLGAKDNFWPSNAPTDGPNGPCGPCSEIHYDYGCCTIGKKCPAPDDCKPGCPCGRFVEVWNLVFTQYDRQPDGSLKDLPSKNIDTGMGLERLTAVMQDKMSVFETDLFQPLVEAVETLVRSSTGSERTEPVTVSSSNRDRTSIYAIADHVRALTFLVGDGVLPSNEGRGYVLRMLLRKAARAGMARGLTKPFLYQLVPAVTAAMQEPYPDLAARRETIRGAILAEEERFHQMLKEKLPLLREEIKALKGLLSAEAAARFYDTHGISFEEITAECSEAGVMPPPRAEFDQALEELQAKSKSVSGFSKDIFAKDELLGLVATIRQPSEFIGYAGLVGEGKILAIIQENRFVDEAKAPAKVGVILDKTPFYGESGGQVGDTGLLEGRDGKLKVLDTQRVGNVLVHQAEVVEGKIRKADLVDGLVDSHRRLKVAQNHTATHLLHAALRRVLGSHVMQAGSLVAPDHLRFDFSHPQAVPRRDLEAVESLIREWVEKNLGVSVAEMPVAEARRAGATALFGEKYGDTVRVVSIGDVSKELCGGTHLTASGEVGCFTVAGEGSVAAGVRRVEAVTGQDAEDFLKRKTVRLGEEKERAVQRAKEKEREDALQREKLKEAQEQAKQAVEQKIGPFSFIEIEFPEPMGQAVLRSSADVIRRIHPDSIAVCSDSQGFLVVTTGATAQSHGIDANKLWNVAKEEAGALGGGRPDMTQGRVEPVRLAEARGGIIQFIEERSK